MQKQFTISDARSDLVDVGTCSIASGRWGEVFGDDIVAAAMIDRLVHHATIFELNVESYRRRAAIRTRPTTTDDNQTTLESLDATTTRSAASQEPDAVT